MVRYESPDDVSVGDTLKVGDQFWTKVLRSQRGRTVLLRNPTVRDSKRFIRMPLPDWFTFEKHNATARLENRGDSVFIELTEKLPHWRGEMVLRSDWPDRDAVTE